MTASKIQEIENVDFDVDVCVYAHPVISTFLTPP